MVPPPETPVEQLGLPTRAASRLAEIDVLTLADLIGKSEVELIDTNRFSRTVIEEIRGTLATWGLAFRSTVGKPALPLAATRWISVGKRRYACLVEAPRSAFRILSDRTPRALATIHPVTNQELLGVPGIGSGTVA